MLKNGDIVFPVSYRKNDLKILYIENEPKEQIVYNASTIVLRIDESIVDSKYIYIMFKISRNLQRSIEYLCEKNGKQARITANIIDMLYIPKLDIGRRNEIVKEYTKLEKANRKFRNLINEIEELKKMKFI